LGLESSRLIGFHRFPILAKLAKQNFYKKSTEWSREIHRCFKIRIFRLKMTTLFKPLSQRWVYIFGITSSPDLPLSWPRGKPIPSEQEKSKLVFYFHTEFRKLQEQITVTRQMVSLIGFIGWIGLSGLFGLFCLFGSRG